MTVELFTVGVAMTAMATLGLLAAERASVEWGRFVAKPLASLGFLVAGVGAGALEHAWGQWIFVGLVLSFGGDVALLLRSDRAFLVGLGSFLFGHVAFAVAFVVRGASLSAFAASLIPALMATAFVLRWLWSHLEPAMRVPVIAYMAVISTMVALSVGSHVLSSNELLLFGAIGFAVSDVSVARDKFVAPGFGNKAWGLPLYFGAQVCLAASVSSDSASAPLSEHGGHHGFYGSGVEVAKCVQVVCRGGEAAGVEVSGHERAAQPPAMDGAQQGGQLFAGHLLQASIHRGDPRTKQKPAKVASARSALRWARASRSAHT